MVLFKGLLDDGDESCKRFGAALPAPGLGLADAGDTLVGSTLTISVSISSRAAPLAILNGNLNGMLSGMHSMPEIFAVTVWPNGQVAMLSFMECLLRLLRATRSPQASVQPSFATNRDGSRRPCG
jgi:hypothetical protein